MIFAYGYRCCVFKHNIYGDHPEVPEGMPDSINPLPPEFFMNLGCPPVHNALSTMPQGLGYEPIASISTACTVHNASRPRCLPSDPTSDMIPHARVSDIAPVPASERR